MEPITDADRERWAMLARRLYAAWISWRHHHRGVDYVLKRYAPDDEPIGDLWIEIARKVDEFASEKVRRAMRPEE